MTIHHCCERMRNAVEFRCDEHPAVGGCGDYVVGYNEKFDEYGLWVHDGPDASASSWIEIQHCPFCGGQMSSSRRDEWFDRLKGLGIEPECAPPDMQSSKWWLGECLAQEAERQLSRLVSLWFGIRANQSDDPATTVGQILRFNRPVSQPIDGAVEVLVVEQQGVWLWGRNSDGEYVERENARGVPWRQIGETEYEFWLHHAAFEAATNLAASRSAQLFDEQTVSRIKSATIPLPCGEWAWPGTTQTVHARGASVVMICEDGDDFWVVASAPTEEDLDWLDAFDLSWDESDTRLGSQS